MVGLAAMLDAHPLAGAWFVVATISWSLFAIEDGALTGLRRTLWVPIENSAFGIAKIGLLVVFVGSVANVGIFASWTMPAAMLVVPVNWLIFRRFVPRHVGVTSSKPLIPPGSAQGLPAGIVRYLSGDYVGSLFYAASIGLLPLIVIAVVGPSGSAYFYIAWTIASAMYLISVNIATSLMVEGAGRRSALELDARRMFGLLVRVQIVVTVLVVIGAHLILSVFNPAYASEAEGLLRLLALAALPHGVTAIYLAVARVRRQVERIILVQATTAGIALGLSVVLLGPMGIIGAGVAWLVAQTLVALILFAKELLPMWRNAPVDRAEGDRGTQAPAATDRRGSASAHLLPATLEALNAAGVRWCLLRGDAADAERGARDIDLLVDKADHDRLTSVLSTSGYLRVRGYGRGRTSFHVGYDREAAAWVRLDVAADLAYGQFAELETHAAAGCLARRSRSGGVSTLDPDDAFWVLLLHCLLDKAAVAERHRDRLQGLAGIARDDLPMGRMVGSLLPRSWTQDRVRAVVRAGDWDELMDLRAPIIAHLRWSDPVGTLCRTILGVSQRTFGYARLGLHRRGLSVALLGPDGAGKTTLATAIEADFGLPVQRVYMGMWGQRDPGFGQRIPGLAILARPLVVWRKAAAAQIHRARGHVVIFDRYTYDAMLPPTGRHTGLKRVYFWVLAHTAPAPDLVFVLDAPGTTLFARKGESDPASLERDRVAFRSLEGRIRGLQIIDGTRPMETVRADIVERIWQRCLAGAASA
jgi:thymidylate kinase